MRHIILYQILLITSSFFAQNPDPDLFNQTWYLYAVDDSEGDYIDLENWYPDYAPYVIIDESLNFNGVGLCNSFNGILEKHPDQNYFRAIESDVTTDDCNDPYNYEPIFIGPFGYVHSDPEFFTIFNPQITNDPDGFQTMIYGTQPFVGYIYRNTPILSVDDFKENEIYMYPNPTSGTLIIQSKTPIFLIEIYNLLGQLVKSYSKENTIDISSVDQGIYFIKVMDESGNIGSQKVVKK
jgi:hypothetical protein